MGSPNAYGVECANAVHDQGEAQGLGHLVDELAVADSTAVGEVDRLSQPVEVLALVQLAPEAAS